MDKTVERMIMTAVGIGAGVGFLFWLLSAFRNFVDFYLASNDPDMVRVLLLATAEGIPWGILGMVLGVVLFTVLKIASSYLDRLNSQ